MNSTFHSSNLNSESDFFSIKLPEYRKPKLELWSFMSLNDMEALLSCFDSNEFLKSSETTHLTKSSEYKKFSSLIRKQLNLSDSAKKDEILIDKYFYIVKFALANDFSKEQINALLLIFKKTHDMAVETSFGNLDETFDYFKRLLVVYAVHRPPYSVQIFSMEEIELITDYAFDAYFNQFKFYKYIFSFAVRLDVKLKYSNLPSEVSEFVDNSQINSKDFIGDLSSGNKTDAPTEATIQEDKVQESEGYNELKEFIRNYLSDKLKKMKDELSDELVPKNDKGGSKKK